MTRAVVLLALLLSGCGAHVAPQAHAVAGSGVASQSLAGDLLGLVGPFAAKKAIQAAIGTALKKDATSVQNWQADISRKPEAEQKAYLQKRIGALQKTIGAAEIALMPMKNVDNAHAALDALKAEDDLRSRVADKTPAVLLAWGDALAKGLDAFKATF
ncbi:MAG: hypothetical protein JWM80_5512 [Cyanobacteria bacterium RYN_339]|nr:hypothetical protein [Cyanobacteria bacterium RYN_339]